MNEKLEGEFIPEDLAISDQEELDPENKEEEITIEAKYEGENPKLFVIELIKDAHVKGVKLTFKEVMKQIEEAIQEKDEGEEKFSFEKSIQTKSADIIIPKGITFSIKAKPSETIQSAEEQPEEDDLDFDDDDEQKEERESQRKKDKDEKEDDIFETELMKVRDALETTEGTILNRSLEKIKEIGKRLVNKLKGLGNNPLESEIPEPDNIQTDSLELLRFLEEAEENGSKLTKKLKEDFDINLTRSLVPSEYILAYLYKIYKEKGVEIPDKILNSRRSGSSPDTLQKAVDIERLK